VTANTEHKTKHRLLLWNYYWITTVGWTLQHCVQITC